MANKKISPTQLSKLIKEDQENRSKACSDAAKKAIKELCKTYNCAMVIQTMAETDNPPVHKILFKAL